MPETWRRIDREWPEEPYRNLAFEEALVTSVADGTVPPTLRFWRNDRTIVLGRHQCADLEVNYDACDARGVRVVRRFSGGGAVYHDQGNLNYTIVIPREEGPEFLERTRSFAIAADAVVAGLRTLGIDARFQPINDISVGEQKISGLAGTLTKRALLYHGCLLVESDLRVLGDVLNVAKEKLESKAVRSVRKRVTTLRELLGDVDMARVKDAIAAGVAATFGVDVVAGEPHPNELALGDDLLATKYATDRWRLGPCRRCSCRARPDDARLARVMRSD